VASRVSDVGSGIVAVQASVSPSGFVPKPTSTSPLSETAVAEPRDQPVRSIFKSLIKTSLKLLMPLILSHTNGSKPESVLLPPTTTDPSPETSNAKLS